MRCKYCGGHSLAIACDQCREDARLKRKREPEPTDAELIAKAGLPMTESELAAVARSDEEHCCPRCRICMARSGHCDDCQEVVDRDARITALEAKVDKLLREKQG